MVNCENQEEGDPYRDQLSAGGQQGPCGWLKDNLGLSRQIVPAALAKLMSDLDPQKRNRVMKALLEMNKLDIDALRAYEGDAATE